MIDRRHWLLGAGAALVTAQGLAQPNAAAPDRPARLVVGFPPGGSADLIGRALAQNMGHYAASVLVDNKPGAGGRLAIEAVKAAEPDGTTLLVTPSSMMSVYPHVYRRLNYDLANDFVPVALVASFPFVLVVGPMVPDAVRSVADFVAWCRANPKQGAYASSGSGSTPHFAGVALARAAGVDLLHVPYKGGAPAMTDVIGGQIASNMAVISNALPHIQSGKVRALAVTGPKRSGALPTVPTMNEAGFPDVAVTEWFGVYLPRRAAADQVARAHRAVLEAMKSRAVTEVLQKAAFDPAAPMSPAEIAAYLRTDITRWGQIVKASGFTPED